MTKRSIPLMIVLALCTFGIYGLYWYCSFQNQLKKETGKGFGGAGHLFATLFTFGIYALVWNFKVGGRLEALGVSNHGVLYLVLAFTPAGFINSFLMQAEANKIAKEA